MTPQNDDVVAALEVQLVNTEFDLPPSSFAPFSKNVPIELFYHISEQSSSSALLNLCLVSSFVRAIASPILYKSMNIENTDQLRPFLPASFTPRAFSDRSLTLDKVVSLRLAIPWGDLPSELVLQQDYPPIPLPNLLHLSLKSRYQPRPPRKPRRGAPVQTSYIPYLALARHLLTLLNPRTLTLLPDPSRSTIWDAVPISSDEWDAIRPHWDRLSTVRFIDGSCYFTDGGQSTNTFFPGVESPHIAFSWTFSPVRGGCYSDTVVRRNLGPLPSFEAMGVFAHPSVRANGIKLLVGERAKDRQAVATDLEELSEELRSLVRY